MAFPLSFLNNISCEQAEGEHNVVDDGKAQAPSANGDAD